MGRAEAFTNSGRRGGTEGLGLLLRRKGATLLTQASRSLSEGAKGRYPKGASPKVGSADPAAIAACLPGILGGGATAREVEVAGFSKNRVH